MSSKWPEAIPLRTITARVVAQGMIEIFSRTGIPLQLLTDQGSQFLGSLVTHLCRDLHIDDQNYTLSPRMQRGSRKNAWYTWVHANQGKCIRS